MLGSVCAAFTARPAAPGAAVGLVILPLNFENLELLLIRWDESDAALYSFVTFLTIFDHYAEFVDDLRVLKLLVRLLFPQDAGLLNQIEGQEREADTKTLELLIKDLTNLENTMRQNGIATAGNAIQNLIFLVFLKVYEEKRERNGQRNRLRSEQAFESYRSDVNPVAQAERRAIHELFNSVKQTPEFQQSGMFVATDTLANSLTDDFILTSFIPKMKGYTFEGTRVDALGAVYEVLALRAEKDVKAGQFFTPENVVRFMVNLADLRYDDRILDPACGTGRFLIYGMEAMLKRLSLSNERGKATKEAAIRQKQLFGADIDERVAKIAKMNMWIHGDGKSNIFGGHDFSGLMLHKHRAVDTGGATLFNSFDGQFDVILANPPLGDLNYQGIDVALPGETLTAEERVTRTLERIPVLPRKDLRQERIGDMRRALIKLETELAQLQADVAPANKIATKQRAIAAKQAQLAAAEAAMSATAPELQITGSGLKGGALFLTAMWHYLKAVGDADAVPEWRGGRLLVILDEGVLNTETYRATRDFLRSHFYLKAVVSLTRDTFIPISKTSTKTSIYYAVKNRPPCSTARTCFLGHVAYTGLDTKGKATHNDFDDMLRSYRSFQEAVQMAYQGGQEFQEAGFNWQNGAL